MLGRQEFAGFFRTLENMQESYDFVAAADVLNLVEHAVGCLNSPRGACVRSMVSPELWPRRLCPRASVIKATKPRIRGIIIPGFRMLGLSRILHRCALVSSGLTRRASGEGMKRGGDGSPPVWFAADCDHAWGIAVARMIQLVRASTTRGW